MIPRSLPKAEKTEYNWPIPEDYWPSAAMLSLPPRSAHALIKFQTNACTPVTDKIPFDKYELEPSPLTQYILERRQPTMAWPVSFALFESRTRCVLAGLRPRVISRRSNRSRFTFRLSQSKLESNLGQSVHYALQLSRIGYSTR